MIRPQRILATRRRRLAAMVMCVLAVAAGLAAAYVYRHLRPGDVVHPHARFVAEAPAKLKPGPDRFAWPLYGYSKEHTRYFPADPSLHGPWIYRWVYHGSSLLEFPPVISGGTIYQLNDDAELVAIVKSSGRVRWRRRLGVLSAAAPAASGDSVYVTILERARNSPFGRVVALRQRDGGIRWSRKLPSRSESSPLLDRGRLYFGSENGTVYALSARNGSVLWTYHAGGAVKASPSYRDDKLFFGDYGGDVTAIRERDGQRVWSTASAGTLFGAGTFYSTPAVIYGRVFLGNTDGRVYAFDEHTGKLDWAKQTGNYVYSSPAVTDTPGLGPTVYIGSYDGTFYALSARTGAVHWRYHAGGRISGSPTIVGSIVYLAVLGTRRTIGLNTRTGRPVFSRPTGSFDPIISDGHWLFLTGYTGLYALGPRSEVIHGASPVKPAPPAPGTAPKTPKAPPGTAPRTAPKPAGPRPPGTAPRLRRPRTPAELCQSRACKRRMYFRLHPRSPRQLCQSRACKRRQWFLHHPRGH